MLALGLGELLKLRTKKPPGLIHSEDKDIDSDDEQKPETNKVKSGTMSSISLKKVDEKKQKASDSHDSNFAFVNYKSDSAQWTDNRGKDEEKGEMASMFAWSWTDLLEVMIFCGVIFFIWAYLRKRRNKLREKKLTKNTKEIVDQMKTVRDSVVSIPSAPPSATMTMPMTTQAIVPFQHSSPAMVLPANVATHKPASGLSAIRYSSNIYETP